MKSDFRQAIASSLGTTQEHVTLFWKGRVALFALLKSFGIKPGDEVILPAFTCVVVPNAILYCEAVPVYVDIDPNSLNATAETIRNAITSKTKFILAQNTFGLSADLDPILELARENQLIVIEDCTHGFGGSYKGRINGTIADAAFFSSQWNKPFSTGIGGMAFTRDPQIASKMRQYEEQANKPGFLASTQLQLLLFARAWMKSPAVYWPMIKLYRWLSKHNFVVGSSDGGELNSIDMPEGFLRQMSKVQQNRGVAELSKLQKYNFHRIKLAEAYTLHLASLGIIIPSLPEHTYLKFPLLVKNRDMFMEMAEKQRIELGEWFISPIHPVVQNFELWKYPYGNFPNAEYAASHIVNLPTHIDVDDAYLGRILDFLSVHREQLLSFE
jgi:dTDP-4-amino-4,6-dideoxygalactose transaminase